MSASATAPSVAAPVHNADIAAVFDEIADLLEIERGNPFRIRAYRNAARVINGTSTDFGARVARGEDLKVLPGIGDHIAAHIEEIVRSGHCTELDRLRKDVPPELAELLRVPGLGPRRVQALWQQLGVHTLEQLARAAHDGRLRNLPGFGEKTEQRIVQAVDAHRATERRFKPIVAAQYGEPLAAELAKAPGVSQVAIAGSYRRMRDTVGDLDLVVAAAPGSDVMQRFVHHAEVVEVMSEGKTRSSVRLRSGLQVDLRVVDPAYFGAALMYFTGSKAHNIELRRIAQDRGLKLNEYGLFRGERRIAGRDEASVYRALGLPPIAPELREARGEIEAARANRLPSLVELADLRGDLHVHTKATDGHDSLEAMAAAAHDAGLQYIAITEHSRRLTMAHGLDEKRLLAQCDEIDRFNATPRHGRITVLKGIEVDILEDGSLDLPDAVLARLDVVVGAVHSRFELPRRRQTDRILKALDSPHFHILAHPSGRLIGEREPYDVDLSRIIRHAAERGIALELNAHPDRLDLLDTQCQEAKQAGVRIAVNSDAHSTLDFANLRFGIGQARRGWLERADVLNALPLEKLRRWLARTR